MAGEKPILGGKTNFNGKTNSQGGKKKDGAELVSLNWKSGKGKREGKGKVTEEGVPDTELGRKRGGGG